MPCAHISDLNLRACRGLELGYDPTLGAEDGALCQNSGSQRLATTRRGPLVCYHKKGLLGLFGSE